MFDRIRNDLLKDLSTCNSGENWAHALLTASSRCKTEKEQQEFFDFIFNPSQCESIPPVKLQPITHPQTDNIPEREFFKLRETLSDDEKCGEIEREIEHQNSIIKNGSITHILVEPLAQCVD